MKQVESSVPLSPVEHFTTFQLFVSVLTSHNFPCFSLSLLSLHFQLQASVFKKTAHISLILPHVWVDPAGKQRENQIRQLSINKICFLLRQGQPFLKQGMMIVMICAISAVLPFIQRSLFLGQRAGKQKRRAFSSRKCLKLSEWVYLCMYDFFVCVCRLEEQTHLLVHLLCFPLLHNAAAATGQRGLTVGFKWRGGGGEGAGTEVGYGVWRVDRTEWVVHEGGRW